VSDPSAPPAAAGSSGRVRLGPSYAKLWAATAISTTGDGIYYTALPLLAATLTRDPLTISMVFLAGQLPWLLFALPAGALLDRVDRRRLLWTVDAARFAIVGALGVAVLTGWATIPVLAAAGFLLGVGQTLYDTAAQVIVPTLVSRQPARLERANGRINSAMLVGEQLAGPPAGGLLFSAAPAVPFLADAASFAASSALVAAIPGRYAHRRDPDAAATTMQAEIAEGLGWLWRHRLLRTLAVMVGVMNLTSAAWSAIFVLFAQDKLGLGSVGYGVLLTGLAAGGALGGLVAVRLSRRLGPGPLLIATVVGEGAAELAVGASSNAWLVGAVFTIVGLLVVVWNVLTVSLRRVGRAGVSGPEDLKAKALAALHRLQRLPHLVQSFFRIRTCVTSPPEQSTYLLSPW
jgi:Na+/melibiose symporter-like transporter